MACQCDPWIPEVIIQARPKPVMKNKKLQVREEKIKRSLKNDEDEEDEEEE